MFNKPNYTQTPNEFFDDIAKTLKEGELRLMLVIMRQTFGWGNKLWDRISLSQFVEKTGMEEKSVCRSLKVLVEKKLIVKHKTGKIGREESWYSLMVENPSEFEKPIDNPNNFYPCPKDSPTPVLKTDTKETLTKEIKKSILRMPKEKSAPPPPPSDCPYSGRFEERIQMTMEQYKRIAEKHGPEKIDEYAEKLYRWSHNNETQFRKKKRHDLVIEDWIEKDLKQPKKEPKEHWSEKELNPAQIENWRKNQELIEELKKTLPHKCKGLEFYYKAHLLKDKNRENFSICGLINTKDFSRLLEKHFDITIEL